MKQLLSGIFFLIICNSIHSQPNAVLEKRVKEFMQFNDEMNFEKVLDYTYPKLFTLAPRADMLKVFKDMYNSEEFSITLDSLKIDSIYPVFRFEEGEYAKIRYSMLMRMKFTKDSLVKAGDENSENSMIEAMKTQFGEGKVRLDKLNNALNIDVAADMVAAKDSYAKEWCFVNFKEEDKITEALFTKGLIQKIAGYK